MCAALMCMRKGQGSAVDVVVRPTAAEVIRLVSIVACVTVTCIADETKRLRKQRRATEARETEGLEVEQGKESNCGYRSAWLCDEATVARLLCVSVDLTGV